MSKTISNTFAMRAVAVFVGLMTGVLLLGGTFALPTHAQTVSELQTQINSLLATIASLQSQIAGLTGGGTGAGTGYVFNTNLTLGSTGEDVRQLQIALNSLACCQLAASGAGSPGNETSFFGPITRTAVIKFQDANASTVLTPLGLSKGTGFFGPSSRAQLNTLMAQTGGTGTGTGTGTGSSGGTFEGNVTVSAAASQPANGIAPKSAARVPFTNVTFTAGPTGATVDSIKVKRGGVSANSDISGVVLIDEQGVQLGVEKSLNSDNETTLTEDFTVNPNSSRTMTIGANMAASPGAGNVMTLAVIDVVVKNGSVSGSLPITGAAHTVNTATTIGSVTVTALSHTSVTKEIGTTGYIFSSFRLTNGSTEKARLHSIKWNQTGSAGADDLTNCVTEVDGTPHSMTVSSDGKFFTSVISGGKVLDKGFSAEIRAKCDIEGGSNRTIIFDIHRRTDVNIVGEQFGFGITPPAGSGTAAANNNVFTAGTPWLDGPTITIGGGSLQLSKATTVNAQNVSENVADQLLGGYDIEVKGEEISVGQMDFFFDVSGASGDAADLTNVTFVRQDTGAILAGPVDGSVTSGTQRVRFTDTVIFPTGKFTYVLKGKLGTDFANNDQLTASTTPGTDFSTVTGQTTSDTITPTPSTAVTANPVTVKSGALTISIGSVPLAQTIVAGGPFIFANVEFDASQSGDDIRLSSIPLEYGGTGEVKNLTNCQLLDNGTSLTTGSNRVNPTAFGSSTTFTFDTPKDFPKGVVTTLGVQCDTTATTTGTSYRWGVDSGATITPTAVGSGETISETVNDNAGQLITLNTGGSYTVVDDSSPGYRMVSPGTEVTLMRLKFSATNEDVDIKRIGFQVGSEADGTTASSSPKDLVGRQLRIFNGSNQIATAVISESGVTADYATSTEIALGNLRVPRDGSVTVEIKGTVAGISQSSGPLTASGDLFKVDWDAHDANSTTPSSGANYGTGVSGGTDFAPSTTADVGLGNTVGVRIMKAHPTFTKLDLSSSERQLIAGSQRTLYKFKVDTNGGEVAFYKFTFNVSSSTVGRATTSLFSLYAFTDSAFSQADTTFSNDGLVNSGQCFNGSNKTGAGASGKGSTNQVPTVEIFPDKGTGGGASADCNNATTTYHFTGTRWFELEGTVATVDTASGDPKDTVEVDLQGDAAFPVNSSTLLSKPAAGDTHGVDGDTHDDLIWSPRSTSTSASIDDLDWTNGYQVPGVPTTNMAKESIIEP